MKKRKTKKTESKYPPYPSSNWDYGVKMAAAQQLVPPNRAICIYCHAQACFEAHIIHAPDCPTKDE